MVWVINIIRIYIYTYIYIDYSILHAMIYFSIDNWVYHGYLYIYIHTQLYYILISLGDYNINNEHLLHI